MTPVMEPHNNSAFHWTELPAADILAQLRHLAGQPSARAVSGFLDAHQWIPLLAQPDITIEGGYPWAQYRRAALGAASNEFAFFKITPNQLPDGIHTPRQIRIWLYRAGLPPDSIGDIICGREFTIMAVEQGIEPLEVGLPAGLVPVWALPTVDLRRATAAGPRADAVLTALFRVSRGEAQTAIEHGFVFCNAAPVTKRTHQLHAGDNLLFRTKGRAELVSMETNPRSGRIWVEYRSFPA